MHTADLGDPQRPTYAALSYTWGDPITVYEDPLPDLASLTLEEHADLHPFAYCSPTLDIGDPDEEQRRFIMID